MLDRIKMIKRKMDESLEQLCKVSWMFSKQPEKDFTRKRKLSFSKLVSFLLAMEGGTLTTELLKHFGCSSDIASAPAFVQQRSKLAPETFHALFDLFVRKTQPFRLYKGFRLFAADGSDIQIPNNPEHISSHYPGVNRQSPIIFCIWMLFMICFSIPIRMLLQLETDRPMNALRYAAWLTVPKQKSAYYR